ncbi:rhodanese-like domain-containing protein, partial [Staphylococcus aureus]
YRAARILKKNGYTDIYMLKGGYKKWTGKIKSKK